LFVFSTFSANFDDDAVEKLPSSIYQGVYYGWAKLLKKGNDQIYQMVTSVGTNPFYNGEKKTMVEIKIYLLFDIERIDFRKHI
jgi:FAD synthase